MQTIQLPYGQNNQTLHIAASRLAAVLRPQRALKAKATQEAMVQAALEYPIASRRLSELA